jgi:hypothetical protein
MRLLAIAMLLASCASEEPRRVAKTHTPVAIARADTTIAADPRDTIVVADARGTAVAADPRDATRRAAHDVLAEHCGECHEGHRPTAKPKALAVFDLDQPDWPLRFDEHRYQAALRRLASKSDAAREAFIAFRDAELASSSTTAN